MSKILAAVSFAAAMTAFAGGPAHANGCNGVVSPAEWGCAPWDNNNGPQFKHYKKPSGGGSSVPAAAAAQQQRPMIQPGGGNGIVAQGGGNIVTNTSANRQGGNGIVAQGGGN
jgi:hypothetical protein